MIDYRDIADGKVVKTRKDHYCEWCNDLLPKGGEFISRKYILGDIFISSHMHKECFKALDETDFDGVECEFRQGENQRGQPIDWDSY